LRRPGPPGNVTRAANKIAARPRRESRTTGSTGTSRKIATVERREASVSFFKRKRTRLEQDAARRSWRADPGASPALVRPSGLRTASRGGKEKMCIGEVPKKKGEGRG